MCWGTLKAGFNVQKISVEHLWLILLLETALTSKLTSLPSAVHSFSWSPCINGLLLFLVPVTVTLVWLPHSVLTVRLAQEEKPCCSSKFNVVVQELWVSRTDDCRFWWFHRTIKVGKDDKDHLVQPPTCHSCPLNHNPRCHIYPLAENLQGWRLHALPGQPVPVPHLSCEKKAFFLTSSLNLLWHNLRPFPFILSLVTQKKRPTSASLQPPFR